MKSLVIGARINMDNNPTPPANLSSPPETTIAPPVEASRAEPEFLPLDPQVITLWRIHQAIGSAVLMGVLVIPALVLVVNVRGTFLLAAAAWSLIALFRVFMFFWYPPRAYRAWGYRIDGKVLETRSGVWFRVIQLLPLSRLQHVDLHRGPIERSLGLASLMLHTAGTVQSAISIPGLEAGRAAQLRDQLAAIGGDDAV
jgi:membrane protein YdbS with pleckstrin-like domain